MWAAIKCFKSALGVSPEYFILITFETVLETLVRFITQVSSEVSGEPEHVCNLARAFFFIINKVLTQNKKRLKSRLLWICQLYTFEGGAHMRFVLKLRMLDYVKLLFKPATY